MKRTAFATGAAVLILGFWAFASDGAPRSGDDRLPANFLGFSSIIRPTSLEMMHRIDGGFYGLGGFRYDRDRTDLLMRAGAAYMLPRRILFFRLYGGGGLEYSRDRRTLKPLILAGTRFWIFYIDVSYPLERKGEPVSQAGFSLSF
ncbi:MAG: hypothetical protein JW742_08110 [Candidatus Aminicenantes bacterium]|nr:hypothetical protein [Candidatus Aminicenantes bacterium]